MSWSTFGQIIPLVFTGLSPMGGHVLPLQWHKACKTLAFRTELHTIPFAEGYLKADIRLSAEWTNRLALDKQPTVGLVWAGGDLFAANARRNNPLPTFESWGPLPMSLYSLQVGETAQRSLIDLKAAQWHGPNIKDHKDLLGDFADTTALIDNHVSVNKSVAHLAGAFGKPIWLLNRFDGCWRWLKDRSNTPW